VSAAVLVAEFLLDGSRPTAADVVDAAVARGARFLAADIVEGEGEAPDAHVAGHRVSSLARLHAVALRHQVGLYLRLTDTLALPGLAEALGAAKETSAAKLRDRLVVVVDGERAGRRLRLDAPQFPSAFALGAEGRKGLLRFMSPNFQRARSDADDLVVPWGRFDARALTRFRTDLAKRGARLWISGVSEPDVAAASAVGAAGVVVRWRFTKTP
jgi:hypothetical protein